MALHMNVIKFSFSLASPSGSFPLKTLNLFSRVKFNGEGEVVVVDHVYQFFNKCRSCNISTDNEICRLFPSHLKEESEVGTRSCQPNLSTIGNSSWRYF